MKSPSAKLSNRNASYQGSLCIKVANDVVPWARDVIALLWENGMFGVGCKLRDHGIDDSNIAHLSMEEKYHCTCSNVWYQVRMLYLGTRFARVLKSLHDNPVTTEFRLGLRTHYSDDPEKLALLECLLVKMSVSLDFF